MKSIPEYAYESLVEEIRAFQAELSDEYEVGITTGGGGPTIYVTSVQGGDLMIVLKGQDQEGRQAVLIQHYTQVSVQMVAMPKLADKARRIGF